MLFNLKFSKLLGYQVPHPVTEHMQVCRSLQYNKVAAYIAGYSKKNIKAPKIIHCVGHSLGGALASLATA